jgi:hypothetical protein
LGNTRTYERGVQPEHRSRARESLVVVFLVFSKGNRLAHKYSTDLNYEDCVVEMQHLPLVHKTKFGKAELKLLELLNILTDYKLPVCLKPDFLT